MQWDSCPDMLSTAENWFCRPLGPVNSGQDGMGWEFLALSSLQEERHHLCRVAGCVRRTLPTSSSIVQQSLVLVFLVGSVKGQSWPTALCLSRLCPFHLCFLGPVGLKDLCA